MSTKSVLKNVKEQRKAMQIEEPEEREPVQEAKKSKVNRLAPKQAREHGIVYIGHLPYGFLEEGLQQYFTQFGDVIGVKVVRSKKTNRSQGFGFVKFEDKDVAEIAAKTMNGYFIKERKLVCHVLSEQHPDPFTYKHGSKKLHFINWAVKFREESNKEKSDGQVAKEVQQLLEREEERRRKLKELGINYQYKGFKEQLQAK